MLRIHEYSSTTGELSSVYLRRAGELAEAPLELVSDEGVWALPPGALAAVLARFGAPFDEDARSSLIATLHLGENESLRHVRHLAGYDVIARDYLVYERPNHEALCALGATIAAALLHLGRAQATPTWQR